MRAVIFAAGELYEPELVRQLLDSPDLVLCADGGLRHAQALGLAPTLILGDLDSVDPQLLAAYTADGVPVIQVPVEKDQTDTQLALAEAVRLGATEILLVGGTGSRVDHTLANLLLMPGVSVPIKMLDGKNLIQILPPGGSVRVTGEPGSYLSLIPLTPVATGVSVDGVHWPLHQATLRWGESLGVSNRMEGHEAQVSVAEGFLLLVQASD